MASARACAPRPEGASSRGAGGKGGSASRPDAGKRRFPGSLRLRARREFNNVYRRGRRAASTSIVVFGLPNDLSGCRLGITITRKVGGAVKRNRFKRMVRDIFRRNHQSLQPAMDLVVNARPGAPDVTTAALEKELLGCFARLRQKVEG